MAKLSRVDWKKHEQACELVDCDRILTEDEREFILDNWNPLATNNVGMAGAFFTPREWAEALMVRLSPKGRILDFCAGIGRLAYTAWNWGYDKKEIVCVEINPDFVKVGKRVLPEATWITGNGYDKALIESLGTFDQVVSNPPFGKVATISGSGKNWLLTHAQGADVMAVEIGAQLAGSGVYIIPSDKTDYNYEKREFQKEQSISRFLKARWPDFNISPWMAGDDITDDDGKPIKWQGATPKCEVVDFSISP